MRSRPHKLQEYAGAVGSLEKSLRCPQSLTNSSSGKRLSFASANIRSRYFYHVGVSSELEIFYAHPYLRRNVLISTSERSPLSDGAHPSFDTYHSMQPFSHPTSPSSGRSIPNGPWDVTLSESSSSAVLGDPLMTWEPLRSAKFHH